MTVTCDADGLMTVSVKDNGRGISEEGISRLFKPFSQAEGEGACVARVTPPETQQLNGGR